MTISRAPAILLIRHMFRGLGFRREIILWFERAPDKIEEPDLGGLTMVKLDESNLPVLMSQGLLPDSGFLSFLRKLSMKSYERQKGAILEEVYLRMAKGDVGFAAICHGRPIGWIWVLMQDHKYEPDLDCTIHLDKNSSILYNLHVYPEYQGKGYGKLLAWYAIQYRFHQGASRICMLIEHDNIPSIKTALRLGFRPTKRIKRIQLLGYSKITEEVLDDAKV